MPDRGSEPVAPPSGSSLAPRLPSPPHPGHPRAAGRTAVAAVAVALVLLLSVVLLGGGGTSNGTPVTFSSARTTATLAAPHGPWTLIAALGLGFANETTLPVNITAPPNCTITSLAGGVPSSLSIPSFHGNLTSGVATDWILAYLQPSTHSELEVSVLDGAANLVIELSGTGCASLTGDFREVPSSVVDSPMVASAVAAAGGAEFLKAHPTGVSEEMVLLSPNVTAAPAGGAVWEFVYSTCPGLLTGPSFAGPGTMFSAAVNATTGVVVPGSPMTHVCGGPPTPTLGSALQPGTPTLIRGAGTGGTLASQGCTSGDYCYETPILAALDNVTPGDFWMNVTNATGSEFSAVGFAITNAAGQVVVFSTGPFETSWTSGVGNSSTLLTSSMTFSVDMGTVDPSGGGYFVELTGTGPFADSSEGWGLP